MSERVTLFQTLMTDLGLGKTIQSMIGGVLRDGSGDPVTIEDPYTQTTLAVYPDCGADLAAQA